MKVQSSLNVAEIHVQSIDLGLTIFPAQNMQASVGQQSSNISGAEKATRRITGPYGRSRQLRRRRISPQVWALDTDFAAHVRRFAIFPAEQNPGFFHGKASRHCGA